MVNIHPSAKFHPSSFIHPTALIGPRVVIRNNCYIGPYCVIGYPPEWKGKEDECKGVIISNNCRLTGHVTVDTGAEHYTLIGKGAYLMKFSHCGHDTWIGEGVVLSCGVKVGGHTQIRPFTTVGLNACIHQKVTIPEGCMIGMGAVVTKKTELQPYSKYVGNPARYLSPNIKQ